MAGRRMVDGERNLEAEGRRLHGDAPLAVWFVSLDRFSTRAAQVLSFSSPPGRGSWAEPIETRISVAEVAGAHRSCEMR
jgi:hypothetical protein